MTESRRVKGRRAVTALIAVVFLLAAGRGLHGAPAPRQLSAEVQRLEERLAAELSATERHDALVSLARLRQLSGNLAAAAGLWLEAAALNPDDDFALVAGAYCLAAIGEWERAAAAIQPLLASGRSGPAVIRARYLDATLRAWTISDISALVALANDPAAIALRPTIFYTLWWTESRDPVSFGGNAPNWERRLLTEFPNSPEARIVASGAMASPVAAPSISAIHSPLWLLLPGIPEEALLDIPVDSTLAELLRSHAAPPQAAPWNPAVAPGPTLVYGQQTGLFRSEANALNHAETLRMAGFPARLSRRVLNGVEHWAVVVPAENAARTAHELRMAGHDSFRVRLD